MILDILLMILESIKNNYYYYLIITILVLIVGLFYYLNEKQNIFKIKNTKYEIGMWLFLLAFSIYTFLFFVHKRNHKHDNSLKIDYSFLNMFKYLGLLVLIILLPLLIINYIIYLHKTNNTLFGSTQTILGVLIVVVVLAIIAKIFSIKKKTSNEECSITNIEGNISFAEYVKYILCIIKHVIFFIPCLLVILVDEINKDIKLTPSSVYLLFFILIILITLLFVVPLIFTYLAKQNKNDILGGQGPFYLNEKRTLGKYQNLDKNITNNVIIPNFNNNSSVESKPLENKPLENKFNNILSLFDTNSENISNENSSNENSSNEDVVRNDYYKTNTSIADNTKGYDFKLFKNDVNGQYNIGAKYNNLSKTYGKFPYNYTYSISFYIYINPQPTNTSIAYTKDTELFNYGFKPVVYYNGKSRKIIIKSRTINNKSDQLDTIYEMTNVKHQKWLYFVINYENNNIDVFIEGKLVGSKNNITPYFVGDKVTIGEQDGIYGSIKEIFYYDKIKTPDSIQFLHNLTKSKDLI
jgi:hypothetical protein